MSDGIIRKRNQTRLNSSDIRLKSEADKENINSLNKPRNVGCLEEENDPETKQKQYFLNEIKATDCKIRNYLNQLAEKREKTRQILQENYEKLQKNEADSHSFIKTECSPIRMVNQDYLKTSPNNSGGDQSRTSHKKNNSLPINSSDFLSNNDSHIKNANNPQSHRDSSHKAEKSKGSGHKYFEENRTSLLEKTSSFFSKYDSFIEKSLLKSRNALSPSTMNNVTTNAANISQKINIVFSENSLSPKRERQLSDFISFSKEEVILGSLLPSQKRSDDFIIFNNKKEEISIIVRLEPTGTTARYLKEYGFFIRDSISKGSDSRISVKLPPSSHKAFKINIETETFSEPPGCNETLGLQVVVESPTYKKGPLVLNVKLELDVPRLGILSSKEEYQCRIQGGKLEVEFDSRQSYFEIILRNEGKSDFSLEISQILNSENLLAESVTIYPKTIILFPGSNHRFSFKLNVKTIPVKSKKISIGFLAAVKETNILYPIIFYINKVN